MTVQQLSPRAAKIQLTAEELGTVFAQGSPVQVGLLRLIPALLAQAESVCGIPFTQKPVAVEMLPAGDGGIAVYLSLREENRRQPKKALRIAARFPEQSHLCACCRQLSGCRGILESSLYSYRAGLVLLLTLRRKNAAPPRMVLGEYGTPYLPGAVGLARMEEYGTCLIRKNAVQTISKGT